MNFNGDGGGEVVSDDDDHRHQHRHDHRTHRRVEIITGTERRRTWPAEVKARIIAESLKPGANVSALAREHGVAVGLLHHWRRAERARRDDHQPFEFVPLVAAGTDRTAPASEARIEIEIGDARVHIRAGADPGVLRMVLAALRSGR